MQLTRDILEFRKFNEPELKKFLYWKFLTRDQEEVREIISQFYFKLIKGKALERYKVDYHTQTTPESQQKNFEKYICRMLVWARAAVKRQNFYGSLFPSSFNSTQVDFIHECKQVDDEEYVSVFDTDPNYDSHCPYAALQAETSDPKLDLHAFVKYLQKRFRNTEPKNLSKFLDIIRLRSRGLGNTDISRLWGVSRQAEDIVYKRLQKIFQEWYQNDQDT